MNECVRNEYDWCTSHEVPFIPYGTDEVCSSFVGQNSVSIAGRPMTRLYVKLKEVELNCSFEHHTYDDCDHSECWNEEEVEEIKGQMIEPGEVRELVQLIESKTLTDMDLASWRDRLGIDPPTTPFEWK
jgi:hypothetical protein